MNRNEFWNINNVSSFRGFDVRDGEVELTEDEFADYLDEVYGDVQVCGSTFGSGQLLKDADPVAFRCSKSDYESDIQAELEKQLDREDSDDIEFIDGDENDEFDDEKEDDDE